MGHVVTSQWIFQSEPVGMGPDQMITRAGIEKATRHALMDLEDISMSQMVAICTEVPSTTGGYHVELGYALAKDKLIMVIGPRMNVFFAIPRVGRCLDWEHFTDYLRTGRYER